MIRRILNNVVEASFQTQGETYQSPFISKDTAALNWLVSAAPYFPVRSSDIKILTEPQQFYNTLLEHCSNARERVSLVSLYLGNGKLEKALVEALNENENLKNGKLKINVLLDYTRGSRCKDNSRTTLQPLLRENEELCKISLYHTPALRGFKKMYLPHRWNELFGLQHMKLYIFDDILIISGGNLSSDYFTNRQDRYFIIKDKQLCDFYCGLVDKVQTFSFIMDKNNDIKLHRNWNYSPYKGSKKKFVENAGDMVRKYIQESIENRNNFKSEGYDTWIFPLIQMGQLGIDQDATVTERLLSQAPQGSKLNIATGYFNLTKKYMRTLIKDSKAQCNILMAHPKANGFLGAKGPAGGIPFAYSLIGKHFRRNSEKLGQADRIKLMEYIREGWTYHAKGLWYYPPESSVPCLTLVGSPNFGERSVRKDLETQLAIVTDNPELRQKLHEECQQLYNLGLPAETDRPVPLWVYFFVYLFRRYF